MTFPTRKTLAAGALKLGGFAAFQAEASVVYVDFPDVVIANDINSPSTFFDLNGDGNPDFTFGHDATDTATDGQQDAIAIAASDPTFVLVANDPGDPILSFFGPGSTIDLAAFANANKVGVLALDEYDGPTPGVRDGVGNWYNGGAGTIGYLGFAMTGLAGDNPGDVHYGWFHVGVGPYDNTTNSLAITAYDYAYESTANTGITIPEPASWALFAAGGTAFAARRRRQDRRQAA